MQFWSNILYKNSYGFSSIRDITFLCLSWSCSHTLSTGCQFKPTQSNLGNQEDRGTVWKSGFEPNAATQTENTSPSVITSQG